MTCCSGGPRAGLSAVSGSAAGARLFALMTSARNAEVRSEHRDTDVLLNSVRVLRLGESISFSLKLLDDCSSELARGAGPPQAMNGQHRRSSSGALIVALRATKWLSKSLTCSFGKSSHYGDLDQRFLSKRTSIESVCFWFGLGESWTGCKLRRCRSRNPGRPPSASPCCT